MNYSFELWADLSDHTDMMEQRELTFDFETFLQGICMLVPYFSEE